MRLIVLAVLLAPGAMTMNQGEVKLQAIQMANENGIREFHGHAQIETATFVLRAEEASYNPQTRQIEAHGDVHPHAEVTALLALMRVPYRNAVAE